MADPGDRLIQIARFGAAHGVRGELRLKLFAESAEALRAYGPLQAADGRSFRIAVARPVAGSPDMLVVRVDGVADRTAAEALTNIDLFIPRDRLPPPDEDDFYLADLIGLKAATVAGEELGSVVGVPNYGAGDLLEIARPSGASLLVPFTRAVVPTVDVAGGRVVIDPPPGLLD